MKLAMKVFHDYNIVMSNDWTGAKNPRWNGGTRTLTSGYIMVRANPSKHSVGKDGYILKHRLIIEEQIGRKLDRKEVVHHINHDRTDNSLENLELLSSHSEHIRIHHDHIKHVNKVKVFISCERCGSTGKNATKTLCHNCYMKDWNRARGIVKSS